MRKGQKLTKGGYQLLGFPMEYMRITQGNNVGSHLGTNAMDNAGKDTGIDETIAPCDCHLVAYDTAQNGNAVFLESDNKVLFRDGTIDFATFMFLHDNYVEDIKRVKRFKQGDTFGDEGTAGRAYGNHAHIEVAKGKFTHCYDRNAQGVYHLPNNVSADLAFVTDGTIIEDKSTFANWTDSSHVPFNQSGSSKPTSTPTTGAVLNSIPSDFVHEKATFYPACTIKIRKAPGLKGQDTGVTYIKGQHVNYDGYVRREGYVWISWTCGDGTRRWMAAGELNSAGVNVKPYGTFK